MKMKKKWNEIFDLGEDGDFFANEVELQEGSQYVYFSGTYRNIEGQEFAGATLEVFLGEPVYVDDDGNIVVPTAWEDYWVLDICIEFDSPEKEKFREMLSSGEYSILVFWDSPVLTGANISFSCYPGEVFLRSVYEHGPFSSMEEAEDYIFQAEKNELDSWYEEGGETCFWRHAPSGEECPPPDFSKYGYRAVEGPSDYWWIEPI